MLGLLSRSRPALGTCLSFLPLIFLYTNARYHDTLVHPSVGPIPSRFRPALGARLHPLVLYVDISYPENSVGASPLGLLSGDPTPRCVCMP